MLLILTDDFLKENVDDINAHLPEFRPFYFLVDGKSGVYI
jgi:hypothetical protein